MEYCWILLTLGQGDKQVIFNNIHKLPLTVVRQYSKIIKTKLWQYQNKQMELTCPTCIQKITTHETTQHE